MNNRIFISMLCLLMAAGGLSLRAQRPQVYNDTMNCRLDSFYYTPWWVWDDWIALSTDDNVRNSVPNVGYPYSSGLGRQACYHRLYTDHPIRIIGLAGAGYSLDTHPGRGYISSMNDMHLDYTYRQESYVLCNEREDMSVEFLGELDWSPSDSCRYLTLPTYYLQGENCYEARERELTWEIREYYFKHPIVVDGYFYVGGTNRSLHRSGEVTIPPSYVETFTVYGSVAPLRNEWEDENYHTHVCPTHNEQYRYGTPAYDGHPEDWRSISERRLYLFIFALYEEIPEREEDSLECPVPTNLRLEDQSGQTGYFSWDDAPEHTAWEVSLDDSTFITHSHILVPISGLYPGRKYSLSVSAICSRDGDTIYSPWSEPLLFSLTGNPDEPDTTGLLSPAALALDIFPNPTSGELTIHCPEAEIQSVELLDPQGRLLQRWESCPAPLRLHHPRGTYLLRVHTSRGTVTRPVVKE